MADARKRPPKGLGVTGRALWRSVSAGLTFRPDELAVLEAACRVRDQCAALEDAVASSPPLVPGSKAQTIVNPAIPELRLQRQLLSQLLGRLDVPEEDDGTAAEWDGLSASARARKAAHARWRGRG